MVRTLDLFMSTVPLKKKIKKLGKTTNLALNDYFSHWH